MSPKPPPESSSWPAPWVQLRSAAYHAFLYRQMVGNASPDARPGDVVAVFDKSGERFGTAFYNPRSRITLRMLTFDDRIVGDAFFIDLLRHAVELRRKILNLDETTNAYRLVHAEGDRFSGLVVDRFDDVLSVELFSMGAQRTITQLLPTLHELCGTRRALVCMDARAAELEHAPKETAPEADDINSVRILENGVRFAVSFANGQKTGFFCDQRENRELLSRWTAERSLLDLCCYSGGFGVYALKKGKARDVTGVDLDERAVDQARHNANLNQVRGRWVHADAFIYLRQMIENGKTWETVVLDPPKFIRTRQEQDEGERKYLDLNRLALQVVAPGGLFLTCSCSGLLGREAFEQLVIRAARGARRKLQILRHSGAGADHPVLSNCPESFYLKAIWARVVE